jgi:CubicO group peptidase (beta-lactamase class C family)
MTISTEQIERQGFDVNRIDHLKRCIEEDIEKKIYGGASLVVTRNDETVFDESIGFADKQRTREVAKRQIFATMSVGKNLTVVSLLQRIERGEAAFTDLVADHIPEFGCRGKERTMMVDLLTQRTGIPNEIPALPIDQIGNLEAVVAAASGSLPETEPGGPVNYSYFFNHAIMAEIVRRLDGGTRRFRDIIRADLFEPLGMVDTSMGLPAGKVAELAEIYPVFDQAGLFDPEMIAMFGMMLPQTPDAEIPGGGYFSTASDLSRFARMLCNGGELDGVRILSEPMVERLHRCETGTQTNSLFDYMLGMRNWRPIPADLSLGFFMRGESTHPMPFGILASSKTIGGLGAGSTCFWVDPVRKMTYSFMSAGLMEDSYSMERHQRLSDLVFSSIVRL